MENIEEIRKQINHKYEYEIKQQIYSFWRHNDITGKEKAIERMEKYLDILIKHNKNSEYIEKCKSYIEKCKKINEEGGK